MSESLENLIALYLSGEASEKQVRQLERWIRVDASAQDRFLRHARMDVALSSAAAAIGDEPIAFPRQHRRVMRPLFAVAAAIALLLGGLTFFPILDRGYTAEIVSVSDSLAPDFRVGDTIETGALTLGAGSLQLRLSDGVEIEIEGPAEADWIAEHHFALTAGLIKVDAGTSGEGFLVETPSARVTDLGTRFEVLSGSTGTDVFVIEGEVEVAPLNLAAEQIRAKAFLSEGDVIRVARGGLTRRLVADDLIDHPFREDGAGPKLPEVAIRAVDVHGMPKRRRFYSIKPGAMGPGARAYSTHSTPRWTALEGEDFPPALIGADCICTFFGDREESDLHLRFVVAQPSDVYILFDPRVDPPSWLREKFARTEDRLRCGPWAGNSATKVLGPGAQPDRYVPFEIWKSKRPIRKAIELGAMGPLADRQAAAMYGIVMQAVAP